MKERCRRQRGWIIKSLNDGHLRALLAILREHGEDAAIEGMANVIRDADGAVMGHADDITWLIGKVRVAARAEERRMRKAGYDHRPVTRRRFERLACFEHGTHAPEPCNADHGHIRLFVSKRGPGVIGVAVEVAP